MRITQAAITIWLALVAGCAAPDVVYEPRRDSLADLQPVSLPEYDAERGIKSAATREEYEAARADRRFVMEQFTYQSDGVTVGAYLYRARTSEGDAAASARRRAGSQPSPIIVFNRGSFVRQEGFAGEMLVMAHRYAQAGFIVIAPHYRGSMGWEGRDELGGGDLKDLMNIVPQTLHIKGADPSRLYLAGESRGGGMVYMALRDGFPARAAAVWGAFTDVEALVAGGTQAGKYAPMIWPDFEQNREAIVKSRSAMYWADRIKAPILIMHGAQDENMPLDQSQRLDTELTRLGKTHQLIIFEGESHIIRDRGKERDAAAVAWFRRF